MLNGCFNNQESAVTAVSRGGYPSKTVNIFSPSTNNHPHVQRARKTFPAHCKRRQGQCNEPQRTAKVEGTETEGLFLSLVINYEMLSLITRLVQNLCVQKRFNEQFSNFSSGASFEPQVPAKTVLAPLSSCSPLPLGLRFNVVFPMPLPKKTFLNRDEREGRGEKQELNSPRLLQHQ